VRCFQYALAQLGRPCPADDVLASFIGPPLRSAFATLLHTTERESIEAAMTLYRQRLADVGLYENRIYDGVPDMLERAKTEASALFVATAKLTVFAERGLRHLGLDHHFAGIYGSELDGRFEAKVDLVSHVLATEGIAAETAVMVGDRAVDILAARANGLRSVGVLWGYGTEGELVDAGVDELCATPGALARCLASLAGRRPTSPLREKGLRRYM